MKLLRCLTHMWMLLLPAWLWFGEIWLGHRHQRLWKDNEWCVLAVIDRRHEATLKGSQSGSSGSILTAYSNQASHQIQVIWTEGGFRGFRGVCGEFNLTWTDKFIPLTNTNCLDSVDLWKGIESQNEVAIVLASVTISILLVSRPYQSGPPQGHQKPKFDYLPVGLWFVSCEYTPLTYQGPVLSGASYKKAVRHLCPYPGQSVSTAKSKATGQQTWGLVVFQDGTTSCCLRLWANFNENVTCIHVCALYLCSV